MNVAGWESEIGFPRGRRYKGKLTVDTRGRIVVNSLSGAVLDQLDRLFNRGTVAGLTEGALLERYVAGGDEAAFAALVARHGPMVLGVCRRVLRDERDVEDAFQATFLVLVRRAATIHDGERVGRWLHGVAHRVAVRARAHSARRFIHEQSVDEPIESRTSDSVSDVAERRELVSIVDEEVTRLPSNLRAPVVLCYLEGMSHDEAARRLRWPVGTVRSRMARARDVLRQRLARRGVTTDGSAIVTALARPPVPPHWFDATVRGSLNFATYPATAAATIASARSAAIARRLLHAMLITKLSYIGAAGLGMALAFGGAGTLAFQGAGHAKPIGLAAAASPTPGAQDPVPKEPAAAPSRSEQSADSAQAAVVAPSFPAPPQPPPLDERRLSEVGRMKPDEAESFNTIFFPKLPPLSLDWVKGIVGFSSGSRPEGLTWEHVYTPALVRARTGLTSSADVLDPKVLAELAARHGVADFSRFRHDFLAGRPGAGGTFRDPSGDFLELLRRLQVIDNARCDVALRENCFRLFQELIQGESSGLSQLQGDLVEASLVRARQRLADETAQFRDGLDELKAAIGLPPRALLVPDPEGIAAFREVFEKVHNWHRDPTRSFKVLPQLIARLPALGEVEVEGRPILGTIEANPDRLEDELAAMMRSAVKNRNSREMAEAARDTDVLLERRTRQHVRRLVEARRAYVVERRSYELASRLIDQVLEQIVAPPAGGTQALAQSAGARIATQGLLDQLDQVRSAQDRLVGLWASFKAERLALYRDLGVLPYDDWKSFYSELEARLGAIK
jgi:RNA polymerase sigma factor (sigma-70 family)